jgi:beta-lactamase superfamily II metal-dependent hydrolase
MQKAVLLLSLILSFAKPMVAKQKEQLDPWKPGCLEIHHISTGRGNSIFCIFPDGTTLLIDAGDMSALHPRVISDRNCPIRPDNSKTAPQWIADYILSVYPQAKQGIDYALITHYHDDHFGEADSSRKRSPNGYLLTGITEVGSILPIHTLIDRGFEEPVNLFSQSFTDKYLSDDYHIVQTLINYKQFIEYQETKGLQHKKFMVGSHTQIIQKNTPKKYPDFRIQNLFGGGKIWYGSGDSSFNALPAGIYPGENPLSLGIRITYGKFDYYTGADIAGIDTNGQQDFNSMEAQSAPIVGAVDVATLNHHGNRDSQSPVWVRSLRPQVWVQQTWSADHPGEDVLRRITSRTLYPGDRDIYSTCMCDANRTVIGSAIDKSYTSTSGHVVVKVAPEGNSYSVIVTDDSTRGNRIKMVKAYRSK